MREVPVISMTIAEAVVSTGIGRKQIEDWIFSGALPAFNIGKGRGKVVIPVNSLIEFLREKSEARDGIRIIPPILARIREKRKAERS